MSTPRKHHYLPQFYLDGFKVEPQKGKNAHIWQIEKRNPQVNYSPAIEDTGCIRDFHTIDFQDEEPDHASVEKMLSNLESEQSALLREIVRAENIADSQIEALAIFISLMRYRVPSFAEHVEESLRNVVHDSFKIMYQAGKFEDLPPELKNLIESKGVDEAIQFKISNWKILGQMFSLGLAPESVGLLTDYKFHLYLANGNNCFITTDNPVALFHPHYEKIRPYGVGLAMAGTELTFPLTSKFLVRAGRDIKPGASSASEAEIKEFNRRSIIMGERYIYASSISPSLVETIENHNHMRAGFVFDNLFYGDGSVHISRFIPVQ
ncbi:MAG: DUF4238 domain-containing protein [Gammaproteobacteria bacterium]|nr:DUF4238 domain-containing protein [Gammaproteobacteria bacterium]MCW8839864.1 DUF4238 domain-containing protein [Gammaproteobacteria bacterium]MCW8958905.1 DUF4238 domain-containing protein [Gammaproteobacteria bacterium]MCW8992421.1 DUF4238 domain-containing protein [Gammaproteobacteria bacterium]